MNICRSQGFAGPSGCVLERGHSGNHKYGNIAAAEAEQLLLDAERYRWLKVRLLGADFDWNKSGTCAMVFEWPETVPVGGNCDQNIDAAMLVVPPGDD